MEAKIEKYIKENYFTDAWIEQGFKAGIKEVVDWSNEPCIMHGNADERVRTGRHLRQGNCYECWQAKDWGIVG